MSEHKKDSPAETIDAENLLNTLEQLTQTMDIMNKVIVRLRHYLHHQLDDHTRSLLTECEDSLGKLVEQTDKSRTIH